MRLGTEWLSGWGSRMELSRGVDCIGTHYWISQIEKCIRTLLAQLFAVAGLISFPRMFTSHIVWVYCHVTATATAAAIWAQTMEQVIRHRCHCFRHFILINSKSNAISQAQERVSAMNVNGEWGCAAERARIKERRDLLTFHTASWQLY